MVALSRDGSLVGLAAGLEVVDTPRRFPRVLVGRALALLQDQVDMAAVSEVALAAEASVEATAVTVSVLGVVSVTKVVVTDLAAPQIGRAHV